MISFFREWTLGVCFALLAGAIIYAVSPNGSTKKSIRIVVAVVVMCSIILPFAQSGLDMDLSFQDDTVNDLVASNELESVVEYQITAAYTDDITEKAEHILSSAGMHKCELTLMTDINDTGSIFIKKAYIKLPDVSLKLEDKTKKELSDLFGEETIIVFS